MPCYTMHVHVRVPAMYLAGTGRGGSQPAQAGHWPLAARATGSTQLLDNS
jgi:hypothetical protein